MNGTSCWNSSWFYSVNLTTEKFKNIRLIGAKKSDDKPLVQEHKAEAGTDTTENLSDAAEEATKDDNEEKNDAMVASEPLVDRDPTPLDEEPEDSNLSFLLLRRPEQWSADVLDDSLGPDDGDIEDVTKCLRDIPEKRSTSVKDGLGSGGTLKIVAALTSNQSGFLGKCV